MFDSFAPVPMSRRRKIFFAASGIAHGTAVAALIVAAMWRVDKLDHERERVSIAVPQVVPGSAGGAQKRAELPDRGPQKPPVKHPPPVHVQPPITHTTEEPASTSTTTSIEPGDGPDTGPGGPDTGAGCTDPLGCGVSVAPPEPPVAPPPPVTPPPPPKPTVVPPNVVEHLRISGETQIQPPDDVKIMMERDGATRVRASFRVCLDADGAVTSTRALSSTGYGAYDQRLTDAMAGWRYRPYSVDGKAIAVCGAVTFIYSAR